MAGSQPRHLSTSCRTTLIDNRTDGFEGALAALQRHWTQLRSAQSRSQLDELERAIIAMFDHMNLAFIDTPWGFSRMSRLGIDAFLAKFDAIFTLNLDLLLERHYVAPATGDYFGRPLAASVPPWPCYSSTRRTGRHSAFEELSPREETELELRHDFQHPRHAKQRSFARSLWILPAWTGLAKPRRFAPGIARNVRKG